MPLDFGYVLDILNGKNVPSMIATSNLRRAISTCVISLWPRLQRTKEKVGRKPLFYSVRCSALRFLSYCGRFFLKPKELRQKILLFDTGLHLQPGMFCCACINYFVAHSPPPHRFMSFHAFKKSVITWTPKPLPTNIQSLPSPSSNSNMIISIVWHSKIFMKRGYHRCIIMEGKMR